MVKALLMANIDNLATERDGELTSRLRWFALVVLCLGQLVIVVDGTVVNVALPVIQVGLHFTQASLAWVVNAYLVTFGGLLLLAGRLGDLFGRKRVFLFGLSLFTVASAFCGLADSETLLIAARFVQGIGAAFSSSMVLGILVTLFSVPTERSKAMTVYATIANIGGSIGLVLGGVLIQYLSWHWIFFINLPIGVSGVIAASFVIPDDNGIGVRGGVDWRGGLLAVGAPTIGVWAIVNAAAVGWFTTETIGLLGLAIALGGLFFYVEGRVHNPLVPLAILRHRQLAAANSLRFFHGFGMSAVLFCGALYMQHVLRYSAFETGLGYMALNVTIGFSSLLVVSRLIRRVGPVRPIIPGFCLIAAGLLLLARAPFDGSYVADVLPTMLVVGIGCSLVFLPSVTIAMTGAGPAESGLASGLTNVTLQIGAAFGTALVASLAAVGTARALARHESTARALTTGYHFGFLVGIVGPTCGVIIAAVFLRRLPRPSAAESLTVEPLLLAE
jgi:EmrB/QacA subfamily drug resistance transporter